MGYQKYLSTPSTSNIVSRDINGNAASNNFNTSATAVTSAGGTTVLTSSSARTQVLQGSSNQTFQLPNATTLVVGWAFEFNNNSTGTLTVVNASSTTICTISSGSYVRVFTISINTAAGIWDAHYLIPRSMSNGQLLIGSGTSTSPTQSTLTASQGFNVSNASGSITLSNLRNGAKYVVSSVAGQGGYTTIQSAINQAVTDGADATTPATVLIWPGSYTENLVLKDFVSLVCLSGNVIVTGNVTYPSGGGTGIVELQNISFTCVTNNPVLSLTTIASINVFDCTFTLTGTSNVIYASQSSSSMYFKGCNFLCIPGSNIFDIDLSIFNITYCNFTNLGNASQIRNATNCVFDYCYGSNFFVFNDSSQANIEFCSINCGSNVFANISVSAAVSIFSCTISSTAGGGYFVTGTGDFSYSNINLLSSANAIDPGLIIVPANTNLGKLISPNISTSPAVSASSSLSLGSAYQNTLGYDVILIVYISVASATTASILCGVGSTNTPTQQTIVSSLTLASLGIIPVTVYLPNNYYALISTSGTISASISGQQVTPV